MPRARQDAPRHRKKPDPVAKVLGARIAQLRREQEFSFDAWVEETGLGRGYISELERGMVVPTIHALTKVARALGLTVADLVLGDSLRERLFEATAGLPDAHLRMLLAKARSLKTNRSG